MSNTIKPHHAVDIQALMHALPVSGLEPQRLATISGLSGKTTDRLWTLLVDLLEPPAGQRVPYIEPQGALEKMLRHQGCEPAVANACASETVVRMKADASLERWAAFFDDIIPDSPECLPLPDFLAWLRNNYTAETRHISSNCTSVITAHVSCVEPMKVPADILDFFDQVGEVATTRPMFRGPDNWSRPWSLQNLPLLPPPKAMIEFVPGPPWDDFDFDWETQNSPFLRWREAMRPVAQELEKVLGEPVYYFKELDAELDDDDVHRFLVLHWCCTHKPESTFVRFLVRISGAMDVEQLKAALIDPVNYQHPFKMNQSLTGLEVETCRFEYLPPDTHKTVGVVFLTEQAREVAQSLLTEHIGANAVIVAPKDLATDTWVKYAARFCREVTRYWVNDGTIDRPISILAVVDLLCVIANEPERVFNDDLKLSEAAEDLFWLALNFDIDARYYVARERLVNPEACFQRRGVPDRVANQQAKRAVFTQELKEIRLDSEFGSSGLWDKEGRSMRYDLLDLPFPLVRRIAAWQRAYDITFNLPDRGDDAWWELHEQDELDLANALQRALGENTTVKMYRHQRWMSIDEVNNQQREYSNESRDS